MSNNTYTYIFLLIFPLFLWISCSEKTAVNNAGALNLKANVKSVKEEFYFASYLFDKVELNEKLYDRYYAFDTNGFYTEYRHVNDFVAKTVIQLDTLPLPDNFHLNDTTRLLWAKMEKKPDIKNSIEPDYIRKIYRYVNDSVFFVNYYNEQTDLELYGIAQLQQGKIHSERIFTRDDDLLSKTDYTYDSKGRLTGKTVYYEKTSFRTDFKYNFGRKYETASYTANHSVSTFNSEGLLEKLKKYTGNTHVSTSVYKYDKSGNIAGVREKNKITGDDFTTTFTYKYDDYGNWTERLEKRHDGNIFVTRRTLEYYR